MDLRDVAHLLVPTEGSRTMKCRLACSWETLHLEHSVLRDLEIIAAAPGAQNRICERCLIDTILDQRHINVDGDNFTKNKPSLYFLAPPALELNDFRYLALHRRATFEHPRNGNVLTGRGRQAGQLKLVHIVRNGERGPVHLLSQLFGRQVPDKHPG